jgi:hypothetical protein
LSSKVRFTRLRLGGGDFPARKFQHVVSRSQIRQILRMAAAHFPLSRVLSLEAD